MREVRNYGFHSEVIRFAISPQIGSAAVADCSTPPQLEENVMLAQEWLDAAGVMHRAYRCEKCKTTFLGTRVEDFSHACDNPRLLDVMRWRCGHEEDVGPCANAAERQHKREVAAKWLCTRCQFKHGFGRFAKGKEDTQRDAMHRPATRTVGATDSYTTKAHSSFDWED